MSGLTIGKTARATGIGVETIRFYERVGLLEEPPRTSSGYRQYPEEVVARLGFIQRAKALGFSLREIKELLQLRADPHASSCDIKSAAQSKLKDIEKKLADLKRMRLALSRLVDECPGEGPLKDCPIVDALEDPVVPTKAGM